MGNIVRPDRPREFYAPRRMIGLSSPPPARFWRALAALSACPGKRRGRDEGYDRDFSRSIRSLTAWADPA